MPVTSRAMDAYGKMRADYGPRAIGAANRAAHDTWNASEPYRNEAAKRGTVMLAGLRGHITPDEMAAIARGRVRARRVRIMAFVGAVCTGAAAATAGVAAWRMTRGPAWVDDTGATDESELEHSGPAAHGANGLDGITHKVKDVAKDAAHKVGDRVKVMAHHDADAASPNENHATED